METTACWEWTGARNRGGYGIKGRRLAHRLAWSEANGRPVPDGMLVLHSCDNPPCVNPAHLRIGTVADNAADRVARNRSWRGGQRRKNGSVRVAPAPVSALELAYWDWAWESATF